MKNKPNGHAAWWAAIHHEFRTRTTWGSLLAFLRWHHTLRRLDVARVRFGHARQGD